MHQMSIQAQAAVAKSSVVKGSGYTSLFASEGMAGGCPGDRTQDIWLHKRN